MEENYLMFEKLPPAKLLLKCAVPAALSMIFSGLYSMADGIFVGRCIGSDALAAVNLVMPLIAIAFSLAELIATGSSVQLATLLGQKEHDRANRTFSVCVKVIVGMSFLIGLVFFFLCKPMLALMGADGNALQYSIEYIRVYAVFAPLIIVFFAVDNYLRICGKQNYSMILNVVLLSVGGATAVAAMAVVMYVESLVASMLFGMVDSVQPAISYCKGAGLHKRVWDLEKWVLAVSAVLSIAVCLILRYCGAFVVPFFVKPGDTELLTLSIHGNFWI